MLKTIIRSFLRWPSEPRRDVCHCRQMYALVTMATRTYTNVNVQKLEAENQNTLDNLYKLSVNIKKIRRLKGWVLQREVAYVEETATILKGMGANELTVASILETCPEAFLQKPVEINAQKSIWNLVCPKDKELIAIIEKFPDSFFSYKNPRNQEGNINYFCQLGLGNKIVCRLLTSAPQIFCNEVGDNKKTIDALEENYRGLGGSMENFKTWLMKLLSQDPFALSKSSLVFQENVAFLQDLGFKNVEVIKLLSKLKSFIFDMRFATMQQGVHFTRTTFDCDGDDLRQLIMKCPALLYYSIPVLDDRFQNLLLEGATVNQIKECPNVLELTPQIIQFRTRKIRQLGREIGGQSLEVISGTKKDFEASYGKLQLRRERPLFNPVAPLSIEE